MVNLATTTSADRETFATQTKAVATLAYQLAAKDIWAKSKEAYIKRLLGGRTPAVTAVAAGLPTSGSLTRPRITITVFHVAPRLGWLTQVPTAPRKILATRMKQPRTT
jgi:hypothetical protein